MTKITHQELDPSLSDEIKNKSDFDGNYESLTNKPLIPSKTSQLENDSSFVTTEESQEKVDTHATVKATTTSLGHVMVDGTTITIDSSGKISSSGGTIPDASTTQKGIVQLNNTLTSTSTTLAATANTVKQVNDKIPVVETGTWTPNISMTNNNGVYSKREGSYVRQGNMVTAFFNLIVTTPPSGSSNYFSITGLPFVASGSIDQMYPVNFSQIYNVKYPGTARTLLGYLGRSGSIVNIRFYDSVSGASNSSELTGVVQNGTELAGSITYYI